MRCTSLSADIDPVLARELAERRSRNGFVSLTGIARDDLIPRKPWTPRSLREFENLVQNLVDRIRQTVNGADVEDLYVDPARGGFNVLCRVRFADELARQDEVASLFHGNVLYRIEIPPERSLITDGPSNRV